MNIDLPTGKYVLAVSGGVDSMVLLDILFKKPNIDLVVAHFNHGIRKDSIKDETLVRSVTAKHGLKLEVGRASLGRGVSEEQARNARYKFLQTVKNKHKAKAIITAHHQDDLVETAIINMLRGTGPRGLAAIGLNKNIKRPLLDKTKQEILEYAKVHQIVWREDSTNLDTNYLRNYIRLNILKELSASKKKEIIKNVEKVAKNINKIDDLIATISHNTLKNSSIIRSKFAVLPSDISNELIVSLLKENKVKEYDKKLVERLSIAIKTALPNTKHMINKNTWMEVSSKTAQIITS